MSREQTRERGPPSASAEIVIVFLLRFELLIVPVIKKLKIQILASEKSFIIYGF